MKSYDLAMQVQALVAYNLDEDDQRFTDSAILLAVRAFVDSLPENDATLPTLNIYAAITTMPAWNGDVITLPLSHLRLIHETITNWLELHA